MNKKTKIIISISIPILIVLIGLFAIYSIFFKIGLDEMRGKGELQETFLSPDEKYQAEYYLINSGGATNGFQERVSITSLTDDKKKFNDETIYWIYPANEKIDIKWKNNSTIVINEEEIDVNNPDTYYNWREKEGHQ